jgi:HK97 family phage portal protein
MFGWNTQKIKAENERKRLELEEKAMTLYQNNFTLGFTNILSYNGNKETLIREGYQGNATVFSIIDLLVKSACNVPPKVYEVRDEGALKDYKSLISGIGNETSMTKASVIRERALSPVYNELYQKLMNPNEMMGYSEWLQEVLGFKYLIGDSFIHAPKRSGTKKIISLDVWPAQYTNILANGLKIEGYRVQHNDFRLEAKVEDVLHIKNFNPDYSGKGNHLYGQSPLSAAYRNLSINNDAVRTGENIIRQQGTRGMITPDPNSGVIYEKEEAERMEAKYKEKHTLQGTHGVNSGILWPSLSMKWTNMALPAADLALMEQYNTSIKDLCGIYKVPSILLNDTAESKVESYREAKKYMYQQGVFPELISLRDELNRAVTPLYGKNLYIDFDFMSVPEIQEDMEKVTKQLNIAWWTTPNEKRKIMKFPPLDDPDMDKVYVPANLLNLSDGVTGDLTGGDPQT